jgi:putative ABC transport system permease protein
MNLILKISLRNLLRQKRRNVLLGIGIAFGMSILIIANSFSHGISDILLNKIIKWMTGHILVTMQEQTKDKKKWAIIRDQERIKQIIQERVVGDKDIYEGISTESGGASGGGHEVSARALGNGSAEMIVVVGTELDDTFYQESQILHGNPEDIKNPNIENPIILYDTLAKNLNVRLNDTLRIRFTTVYGQVQAARFTIVAILKAPNLFMGYASFTSRETMKALLGYQPYETGSFSVIMKNLNDPKRVIEQADRLHEALQPNVAGYQGTLQANGHEQTVQMLAAAPETESRQQFAAQLQSLNGSLEETLADKQAVVLSQPMAEQLGVRVGDQISAVYETRFEGMAPTKTYRVGAIFQPNQVVRAEMVFLHADQMYATFFPSLPKFAAVLNRQSPLFPLLIKEWMLLERSADRTALQKKYKALEDTKWRGAILDVNTMYELASDVLKLEQVMNIVTLVAVLILFFIILIGVVNTLRMTSRERTREIGTVRAIGMQRNDVRWSFVTEVLLLSLFASLAGIVLAFVVMQFLSLYTFNTENILSLFLVKKHLYFLPTIADIGQNLLIILVITFLTAFFPAARAAKLSVAEALRHFE